MSLWPVDTADFIITDLEKFAYLNNLLATILFQDVRLLH